MASLAQTIADRYAGVAGNFNDGPTRRALIIEVIEVAETVMLDTRAEALYDRQASWKEFAEAFTRPELEKLAQLCQITPEGGGRSYDDEVFDALAMVTS